MCFVTNHFWSILTQKWCWTLIKLHITAHITFYLYDSCLITGAEVRIDQKDFWITIIVIQNRFRDVDIADIIFIGQWPDFGWTKNIEGIKNIGSITYKLYWSGSSILNLILNLQIAIMTFKTFIITANNINTISIDHCSMIVTRFLKITDLGPLFHSSCKFVLGDSGLGKAHYLWIRITSSTNNQNWII